jgi:hypothetical protein
MELEMRDASKLTVVATLVGRGDDELARGVAKGIANPVAQDAANVILGKTSRSKAANGLASTYKRIVSSGPARQQSRGPKR